MLLIKFVACKVIVAWHPGLALIPHPIIPLFRLSRQPSVSRGTPYLIDYSERNASVREITPRKKGETQREERKMRHFSLSPPRLAFLAWGDFHARSTISSTRETLARPMMQRGEST